MGGNRLGTRADTRNTNSRSTQLWFLVSPKVLTVLVAVVAISIFYRSLQSSPTALPEVLIKQNVLVDKRWNVSCSAKDYPKIRGCSPLQCARIISDSIVPDGLVKILSGLAHKIMQLTPGGAGGPTIWDFHKGALSFNDRFVDVFAYASSESIRLPFTMGELDALETAVSLIKAELVNKFDLDEDRLFLTSPSFFARIGGGAKPKTVNDEYWHPHVDTVAYGSFTYTALIYLTDYDVDFKGGEFVFRTGPERIVIHPRKGRLSMFTSGSENVHNVEKVTAGKRLALTIAFTCDRSKAIDDFLGRAKQYVIAGQNGKL